MSQQWKKNEGPADGNEKEAFNQPAAANTVWSAVAVSSSVAQCFWRPLLGLHGKKSVICSVWDFLVKFFIFLKLFLLYEVAGLTCSLAAF